MISWNRDSDSVQDIYGALRHHNFYNYKANSSYGLNFKFDYIFLYTYLYTKEKIYKKFNYPLDFINHICPNFLLKEYWNIWEYWQMGESLFLHSHNYELNKSYLNIFISNKNKILLFKKVYQYNIFKNYNYKKKLKLKCSSKLINKSYYLNKIYKDLPSFTLRYDFRIFNSNLDLINCDDEFIYMHNKNERFLQFDVNNLKKPLLFRYPSFYKNFIDSPYLNDHQKLNYKFSAYNLTFNISKKYNDINFMIFTFYQEKEFDKDI